MTRLHFISLMFILGLATGTVVSDTPAILAIALLVAFGIAILGYVRKRYFWLIASLSFSIGAIPRITDHNVPDAPVPVACKRVVEGTITSVPQRLPDKVHLTIETIGLSGCIESKVQPEMREHIATAYVSIRKQGAVPFLRGDRIRFAAHLQPKRRYAQAFRITNDFKTYYTAALTSGTSVVVVEPSSALFERWFQKKRDQLQNIFREMRDEKNARLATALTTGQKTILTPTQMNLFRITGTAHLVVVSGLHLGIIALLTYSLLLMCLRRIPRIAERYNIFKICGVITIPVVMAFAAFTGANPPVVRACVMSVAVLLSPLLNRQTNASQSLVLAALLMLAVTPDHICNAGFQLSFAAVAGFLFFARKGQSKLQHQPETTPKNDSRKPQTIHRIRAAVWRGIRHSAWTSLVAFVSTLPLIAWHFGRIPLIAPLANIIAIPIVSIFLLPLLLFSAAMGLLKADWVQPLIPLIEIPLTLLSWTVENLAKIAPQFESATSFSLMLVIGFTISVLLMLKRRIHVGLAAASICVACAVIFRFAINPAPYDQKTLTLDFLDVGQGDATLITFPNGAHWLLDAGGTATRQIGADHIIPVLNRLGVTRIEKMILTHPDPDHVSGIPDILRQMRVDEVWDNRQGREEPVVYAYNEMIRVATRRHIPFRSGSRLCKTTNVGGVRVTVLHPCNRVLSYYPQYNFNDNSIVLRLSFGKKCALLMGDLSRSGENHLLSTQALGHCELIKLGHHGSATSSGDRFMNRIRPHFAIASCGYLNRYGFPALTVKKTLQKHHIKLFETGNNGWIRAEISREAIKITPQKSHFQQHF